MKPSPFLAQELWWVAVQGANDPSGGWFLLADPGDTGAAQIEQAFQKAGLPIMAAVDAQSLAGLVAGLDTKSCLAWRMENNQWVPSTSTSPAGEVMADLRIAHPRDRILLVSEQAPVHELSHRMDDMVERGTFEAIRLDLRQPPRGLGSWGLARARSQATLSS